jgi:serine-type D-Ala-D-Ala endopeptidase (penicillin-binding protein 7)
VRRFLGFVTPLMLSLAAWPGFAASDVSSVPDTRALRSSRVNDALVWQRALLPGASTAWTVPSHRHVRKRSSDATTSGRLAYVHSSPRSTADYLRAQDCIVGSDVLNGPDAATLAVLDQLPARRVDNAPASSVAEAVKPDSAPARVATAIPEPRRVVEVIQEPVPDIELRPQANAEAPVGKLAIKEPDRELAERFERLRLTSAAALVVDQEEGNLLYAKNPDEVRSIASITKLMTAMVALDAGLPLDEHLTVRPADVRISKGKESRLKVGVSLTRREMLKLALMSSENRAAAAIARTYPGGPTALVEAMNQKAQALGMTDTQFLEPTGLDARNVSTAHDLALMVNAAYGYTLIREFTTSDLHEVPAADRRHSRAVTYYYNSNRLVRDSDWDVGLSKTGYIGKAGRCLVMQATIAAKPVIIVLLDSLGKVARVADANRIKHWLERSDTAVAANKPRM